MFIIYKIITRLIIISVRIIQIFLLDIIITGFQIEILYKQHNEYKMLLYIFLGVICNSKWGNPIEIWFYYIKTY